MSRWLALLLLCLLPLQFSWAAVAGYCAHETGAPAQHLGHHDHQHQPNPQHPGLEPAAPGHGGHAAPAGNAVADASASVIAADAPAGADASKALGSADLDCSQCHGCCAAAARSGQALGLLKPASAQVDRAPCAASSPVAEPPDRPQWAALA